MAYPVCGGIFMARTSMRVVGITAALMLTGGALTTSSAFAQSASCPTVDPSTGITTPSPGPNTDWSGCDLAGASLESYELTGADFAGANLTGASFRLSTLTNVNLSAANLTGTSFDSAVLTGADLAGATVTNDDFDNALLTGANLAGDNLSAASFNNVTSGGISASDAPAEMPPGWTYTVGYLVGSTANLLDANLASAQLAGLDLAGANFQGDTLTAADLAGANVTGTSFWKANLAGADLAGANAGSANFMQADLASTNLTGVNLSTASLIGTQSGEITASHAPAALPQNWEFIDGYLVGPNANLDNADLAGANLSNDDFSYVEMNGANLSGTDLSGAKLGTASLGAVRSGGITGTPASLPFYLTLQDGFIFGQGVDLAGADLAGLNLAKLNISDATLTGANLSNANLDGANLSGSDITRARFAGAQLSGVSFTQASLAGDNLAGLTISDSSLAVTDLSRASLAGATLTGDNLTGANLGRATLTGLRAAGSTGSPSVLPPNWSSFYGYLFGPSANLSGVNLSGDFLVNSDLAGANLSHADLSRTDLASTDLTGTRLNGANLADGILTGAELTAGNRYLAGVRWTGVTCPDGKAAGPHGCFPSAARGPQLSINARVGGPGSTFQLSGSGYRPDEKLSIKVGTRYRSSVRTSRAGRVGPVTISVPGSARPGLVAVTAAASARGQSASAWFTVQVNWSQQGFDPGMTGDDNTENVITPANAGTLRRVWAFGSTGGLNSAYAPAVDAGVAYAVSTSGQLTALSATTGRKLWSWTDPNAGSPFPRVEAPVTAVGNLAFVADTNYLWAIGPGGYVAWKSYITPTSAPTVAGSQLYVADGLGGYLYALNAASGRQLWKVKPGTNGCTSPAYLAGIVYASCGNTLYALSAATGATEWNWTDSDGTLTTSAVSGSTVYVSDAKGDSVYAINAKTGALLWTYSAASRVGAAPSVGKGIVFITTEGGTLEAVNAKTGAQLWQFNLGASGLGDTAPALAGAVVYAASSAGTIYALNPENGKKLWSLAYGEPVLSSPVVANGVLYLGNGSYGVDAFGVR
jgi:uncharacterized protein YjbI with pentapeptide repeats/outer membrane protein assembly factor BamB